MKKILLTTSMLLSLTHFSSKAQFFMGLGAGLNHYGGDVGLLPSLQPRFGYDVKEGKISVIGGFNFSPFRKKTDFSADYVKNTDVVSVPYTESLGINNYFIHLAYRVGNMENAFRFKFIAGYSADLISLKYTANGAIPAGYTTDAWIENQNAAGPKLDFGIGGDLKVGEKGDLFFELLLGLPANQANGQAINNPTVGHQGLSIGYSYYFGSREYNY